MGFELRPGGAKRGRRKATHDSGDAPARNGIDTRGHKNRPISPDPSVSPQHTPTRPAEHRKRSSRVVRTLDIFFSRASRLGSRHTPCARGRFESCQRRRTSAAARHCRARVRTYPHLKTGFLNRQAAKPPSPQGKRAGFDWGCSGPPNPNPFAWRHGGLAVHLCASERDKAPPRVEMGPSR